MRIEYDPGLVERTIFLIARRDSAFESELHAMVDPLYAMAQGSAREAAFQKVHASLFVRFGMPGILEQLLDEQPLIAESVERCIIREAIRRTSESAELFIRANPPQKEKTLMIQVAASSLVEPSNLHSFLRRELLHIADMLDPRFEYRLERFEGTPARQNLARDRYRLLWNIYVEGRLHRSGLGEERIVTRLRETFARLFNWDTNPSARLAFDSIIDAPSLTHPQLMIWATQLDNPLVEAGAA
jgi:hypothetical protein